MNGSRRVIGIVCGIVLSGMAASAQAPEAIGTAGPARASVEQLAWVAGNWTGTLGDRTIQQHWTAPLAGSMIATYRSIRENRPTLYELLAIEQEGDGVVLRIKHFAPGPGLVSQEAKDESMNHPLVRLDGRTAVFEGGAAANPARITFTSPDPSALTITVERRRDGALTSTDFRYRRITD